MFEVAFGFVVGWLACELYIDWNYRVIKKD